MLNQEYEWDNVRYQINRRISYDVDLSFDGRPAKEQLPSGTLLYRLDFPIVFGVFMKVWWMKETAFHRIFDQAGLTASDLRQEWQNRLALKKPAKGGIGELGGRTGEAAARTQVLVVVTTQPVFAWVGIATPLFHKAGGEEQVYLPNLAHGSGPNRSEYARLLRTYTLPAA
ncbi:MAG: hypothetical protein NTW28_12185 [Candidatus Solibacter sp.]|nr:hypothetical protein [Candidatus Solibacter sp.]